MFSRGKIITEGCSPRVDYLDGLRAVAIVAVVGVHWFSGPFGVFVGGYVGVDLFFVLSGFIITSTLWKSRYQTTLTGFLRRRFWRLYPALIGFVAVGTLTLGIFGVRDYWVTGVSALLTLFQLTAVTRPMGLVGLPFFHSWSLSVEWIFYLLWPPVLLRLRAAEPRKLALCAALAAVLLYLAALPTGALWFYYAPVSRSAQLLSGCALAIFIASNPLSGKLSPWMSWGSIVGLLVICAWIVAGPSEQSELYRLVGFPIITLASIGLVLAGQVLKGSGVPRILALKPLASVGRASYSLYLWHLIPPALFGHENVQLPYGLQLPLQIMLTAILTWGSYQWLEKPFLRKRRNPHAAAVMTVR